MIIGKHGDGPRVSKKMINLINEMNVCRFDWRIKEWVSENESIAEKQFVRFFIDIQQLVLNPFKFSNVCKLVGMGIIR